MKGRRLFLIAMCSMVTLLVLAGCSPWVVINQGSTDQWLTVDANNSAGQTFVADYAGLQAVYFYLNPQTSGSGTLTLHLRADTNATADLLSVSLPISQVNQQQLYRFDFSYIPRSANQYFYALLTAAGEGSVQVGAGPADGYQNGSAYANNTPTEAQLRLNLDYDRQAAWIGIAQEVLRWMGIALACLVLFTLPGWAVMSWFWRGWQKLGGFEKLALSTGVSLSIDTLIILITYLLHIQLGRWYAWLPLGAGVIILAWRNRSFFAKIRSSTNARFFGSFNFIREDSFWPGVSLIIILGLIFFVRFWALRGLEQPMWNDSLHHTEITQLMLDHGGLFSSWLPYAPYQTFSMHFGFPASSALLSWVTGIASGQAVLYTGQVLNILAALALYPFTVRLSHGNHFAGVAAVLVAGLLSPMPAYYINWGRYAQLAGQVILPVAMWMLWDGLDDLSSGEEARRWHQLPWMKMIITAGVITGMILFEFRMIFVIVVFVIALGLARLTRYRRGRWRAWLHELVVMTFIGVFSIILFLPWGLRLGRGNLVTYTGFTGQVNTLLGIVKQDYQTWLNIRFYVPLGLIILGVFGFAWAVIRRNWAVASLGIWVLILSVLYALVILRVPWVQYVQSFAVIISLYIPVGVFIGYLAGELMQRIIPWPPAKTVITAAIVVLGMVGAWNLRNIANPSTYAFVTRPDSLAMQWISQNTPATARFLIEGSHENWVTNVIGTDAGWWIPLLAQRQNTIPPHYALANETPIDAGYSTQVVALEAQLEKLSVSSPEGVKLLCDYGISHVYIGQKQGSVGNLGKPLFTPEELASNPVFRLLYHIDQVYIYAVENACGR